MLLNGKPIDLTTLTLQQLKEVDTSIEIFLFKQVTGEPFENSYLANEENFAKLLKLFVSFKKDLMGYFKNQYEIRYSLMTYHVGLDEYEDMLYQDQWDQQEEELTSIIQRYLELAFDLGISALAISLGINYDYSYADALKWISSRAVQSAADITTTTRNRVMAQIKASLDLHETKDQFDLRLKSVFNNPYRGRFIAQQEALNSYHEGKQGLAVDQGLTKKTAISSQAKDAICSRVNGETTDIDKPFSNGFLKPLYHYGCKCDVKYS